MRVLFLSDRVSERGGADLHLLQVVDWSVRVGFDVTLATGRIEDGVSLPPEFPVHLIRGLGSAVESAGRLGELGSLLRHADIVHLQNVMNPVVLRAAAATGRAIVTVQDHRVFCPGMGKSLPGGEICTSVMGAQACSHCVPDAEYRDRILALTAARRDALANCRLIVLSGWMADQLRENGMGRIEVIPPWFSTGQGDGEPRRGFVMGGRLVSHKAVLDGWRAWRESGCSEPLKVAGDGPVADRLEGCDRLGWLPQDRLRVELRRARALLFPSFWQEPFGMMGVEALAEATPVIVAGSGGTRDWTDCGCVVVSQGGVEAMAQAIVRLCDDQATARRLGLEGRAMVARRFDRRSIERRLGRIYESVAAVTS